jgi:hypothetical protein
MARTFVLDLPTLGFAVATRAALGAGIALLMSERIPLERRRRIGIVLTVIGVATTVPIVRTVSRARANTALPSPA